MPDTTFDPALAREAMLCRHTETILTAYLSKNPLPDPAAVRRLRHAVYDALDHCEERAAPDDCPGEGDVVWRHGW